MNAEEKIAHIRHKLDRIIFSGQGSLIERDRLRRELNEAYIDEELFWKNKSRNTWLNVGDRNTRYFHNSAKVRNQRNNINSIIDNQGVVRRGNNQIGEVAIDYFTDLFRSQPVNEALLTYIFQGFQKRVTDEINKELIREVSDDEIYKAMFSIGPHRAPGPDGFTGIFYHQFWNEIKPEVISEVKRFFNEDSLEQLHNQTNLCLIPKIEDPSSMSDFRLIALCNVSYKIISKILVGRLKAHLSGAISENQAAFIPSRMITDNIIIIAYRSEKNNQNPIWH